jgi:hypothetical protein
MVKKTIEHSACRRRLKGDQVTTHTSRATELSSARSWRQTFLKGYFEQAFTRACVREAIRHGPDNPPYCSALMRGGWRKARLLGAGSCLPGGVAGWPTLGNGLRECLGSPPLPVVGARCLSLCSARCVFRRGRRSSVGRRQDRGLRARAQRARPCACFLLLGCALCGGVELHCTDDSMSVGRPCEKTCRFMTNSFSLFLFLFK